LYKSEILPLTLREEYGMKILENSVLGRIFGPKGHEVRGRKNSMMRSFTTCTPYQVLLVWSNQGGRDEHGM
jgi:hypothetical protein